MARKKSRRRSRGMRGFGSVITVRPAMRGLRGGFGRSGGGLGRFRGLGLAAWIGMLLPVLLGIGAPIATILALRYWVNPAAGTTQRKLVAFAPAIGLGVGATSAVVLGLMTGTGAGAAAFTGAALSSGSIAGYDYIRRTRGAGIDASMAMNSASLPPNEGPVAGLRGRRGMGVIVPEFHGLPARTGAIVMEQQVRGLGKPGQEIRLGAVNTQVFGTPGF